VVSSAPEGTRRVASQEEAHGKEGSQGQDKSAPKLCPHEIRAVSTVSRRGNHLFGL